MQRAIELLQGDEAIKFQMRWCLDALHDISHQHEDWLNRPQRVRIAAGRLDEAIKEAVARSGSGQAGEAGKE